MSSLILSQPNFFFDVLFEFLTDLDASRLVSTHRKELYLKQWKRYHVKKTICHYQSNFRPIIHLVSFIPVHWCTSIHSIELSNCGSHVSLDWFPDHVKNVKLSICDTGNNISIKMGNWWEKLIIIMPEPQRNITLSGQSTSLQTLQIFPSDEYLNKLWNLDVQSPFPPTLHSLIIPAIDPSSFFLDNQQHLRLLLQIETLYVESFLPCMERFIMQSKTLTSLRAEFLWNKYVLQQIPPTVTFFIAETSTIIAEKYILSDDFETQLQGMNFLIQLNKSINNSLWTTNIINHGGLPAAVIDKIKKFLSRNDILLSMKLDLIMIFCVYHDYGPTICFNEKFSHINEIIHIFASEILPQILTLEQFEKTTQQSVLLNASHDYYPEFNVVIDGVDFARTCCEKINHCHCLTRK